MSISLSDEELKFLGENVVKPLSSIGYKVWCFGSRARGDGAKFADVDILIEGPGKPRAVISEIEERLIESNFPYKVDLVLEVDLAESYRDSVFADRVLLSVPST